MSAKNLFGLSLAHLALTFNRYQIRHAIHRTQRDLDLTRREIAEKLEAQRILTIDLINLKAEKRMLG